MSLISKCTQSSKLRKKEDGLVPYSRLRRAPEKPCRSAMCWSQNQEVERRVPKMYNAGYTLLANWFSNMMIILAMAVVVISVAKIVHVLCSRRSSGFKRFLWFLASFLPFGYSLYLLSTYQNRNKTGYIETNHIISSSPTEGYFVAVCNALRQKKTDLENAKEIPANLFSQYFRQIPNTYYSTMLYIVTFVALVVTPLEVYQSFFDGKKVFISPVTFALSSCTAAFSLLLSVKAFGEFENEIVKAFTISFGVTALLIYVTIISSSTMYLVMKIANLKVQFSKIATVATYYFGVMYFMLVICLYPSKYFLNVNSNLDLYVDKNLNLFFFSIMLTTVICIFMMIRHFWWLRTRVGLLAAIASFHLYIVFLLIFCSIPSYLVSAYSDTVH